MKSNAETRAALEVAKAQAPDGFARAMLQSHIERLTPKSLHPAWSEDERRARCSSTSPAVRAERKRRAKAARKARRKNR